MVGTQSDEHERQLAQVNQVLKSAAFEVDTQGESVNILLN